MITAACDWDYEKFDGGTEGRAKGKVAVRCLAVLKLMRKRIATLDVAILDTRAVHHTLFQGLTPATCKYFAGNYRGADFHCLRNYEVSIGTIANGAPAAQVSAIMEQLSQLLARQLAGLRSQLAQNPMTPEDEVLTVTAFATELLVAFLAIHPYANGNGHISRFLVWAVLGFFGVWPKTWTFDERPEAPYDYLIYHYRLGNKAPLLDFILDRVNGVPQASRVSWRDRLRSYWLEFKSVFVAVRFE